MPLHTPSSNDGGTGAGQTDNAIPTQKEEDSPNRAPNQQEENIGMT